MEAIRRAPEQPRTATRLPLEAVTDRVPSQAVIGISVVLVALVSVVDWVTGPDLSLIVFYLLPVLLVSWLCSTRVALTFAVLVSAVGLAVAVAGPDGASDPVMAWNATIRLAFYLVVVWLIVTQKRLMVELQHHAVTDPLTGVLNRRALADAADRELARSRRHADAVSVVYLDLDGLKAANDNMGHDAGDAMIVHVAATARRVLRAEDLFARLGGDEFAALLPGADADEAAGIVARLSAGFCDHDGPPVRASFGVWTEVAPDDDFEQLLRHADRLMYEAKSAGGATVRAGGPR